MNEGEFQSVRFATREQWRSGLLVGLSPDSSGGLSLLPIPRLGRRVVSAAEASGLIDLAAGECGRLLWLARGASGALSLEAFEPGLERVSRLQTLDGAAARLFYGGRLLWLLDPVRQRVLGLDPATLQILNEAAGLTAPVDLAAADGGQLVVLDGAGLWLFARGRRRNLLRRKPPAEPLAVAIDPGARTVLYVDGCRSGFGRIDLASGKLSGLGDFDEDVASGYRPDRIVIAGEVVAAVRRGDSVIHAFDLAGTYLGAATLGAARVRALAISSDGTLYAATGDGIHATVGTAGAGRRGVFVTPTLDNGVDPNDLWHRADLDADLPPGSVLEARYAVLLEGDERLAEIRRILKDGGAAGRRLRRLDEMLAGRWSVPERFAAAEQAPAEMPRGFLLRGAAGDEGGSEEPGRAAAGGFPRYAWIRLELKTLSPASPRLRRMEVWRPRLSFLRYLPAFYQDDEPGRRFLERYLSVFETVFQGIEGEIDRLPEDFAPDTAAAELLPWLAGWLDLSFEESWDEGVRRRLLGEAVPIFRRRGTPWAAGRLIEIVTGRRPQIVEVGPMPLVLGTCGRLDLDAVLPPAPAVRPMRLGDRLSGRVLDAEPVSFEESVRRQSHRFRIVLRLSASELRRHRRSLARVLGEAFPALSSCDVQAAPESRLGFSSQIGTTLCLVAARPLRLGVEATLGSAVLSPVDQGPCLAVDTLRPGELRVSPGEAQGGERL